MMKALGLRVGCIVSLLLIGAEGVSAQAVVPDGTVGTAVTRSLNDFTITGGSTAGTNLFHSFREFSIPTGGAAIFNNATNIQNIFSRVTGGSVSNIDGAIRANGTANLFLLNPSGLLFGPNASLNIGGSFVGTTANSIKFADGAEFSAVNVTGTPLLTMSVPIGLQMGSNPGAITVQGPGHKVTTVLPGFKLIFTDHPAGVQVPNGKTLALVGGDILLDGGNLTAQEGQVALAAGRNTQVDFNLSSGLSPLNFTSGLAAGGLISLRNAASIDASGENGGAIQFQGRGLTLQDGSYVFANTLGAGQGKGITVQTTEFVDLLGVSGPGQLIIPGLHTDAFELSTGRSGGITINTGRLLLDNGDTISSISYGEGSRTGDIIIRAKDVEMRNSIPIEPFFVSYIANLVVNGTGQSGNISIEAERVRLFGGATIGADVLVGAGSAGNISIKASDSVTIQGTSQINGKTSLISSGVQPRASGNGGNIILETGSLRLSEGGQLSTAVSGSGNAGNIQIKATEVSVSDVVFDGFTGSLSGISVALGEGATGNAGNLTIAADQLSVLNGGQISSANNGNGKAGNITLNVRDLNVEGAGQLRAISGPLATVDPIEGAVLLQDGQILSSSITASSTTKAAAGSINILADTIRVRNEAEISVSNAGGGDAGDLNLTTRNLLLDNGATLRAEVNGGNQGNINLYVSDLLLLRHGSNINTNAQGTSTGGNITINAPVMAGFENSDIIANAVGGRGGNINITTQGIIGLAFRNTLTPRTDPTNDITASSEFSVNGTVQINTIGVDPNAGLVNLPVNLADPTRQIAQGCAANQSSSFVVTGRGGMPLNPMAQTRSSRPWADTRNLTAVHPPSTTTVSTAPPPPAPLIPATGWRRTAKGKVELYADSTAVTSPTMAGVTCTP